MLQSAAVTFAERCGQKAPVSKALARTRSGLACVRTRPSNLLAACDACYDAGRLQAAT